MQGWQSERKLPTLRAIAHGLQQSTLVMDAVFRYMVELFHSITFLKIKNSRAAVKDCWSFCKNTSHHSLKKITRNPIHSVTLSNLSVSPSSITEPTEKLSIIF